MTWDATKSMRISVKSRYRGYNTFHGTIKIRFAEFDILFTTPVAARTAILFLLQPICYPEKFHKKNETARLRIDMCRNIKRLYNFEPPATAEEIQAASLQFIRKVSGFNKPSQANQAAFQLAVEDVSKVVQALLDSLVTDAAPLDREIEAQKNRARAAKRFG